MLQTFSFDGTGRQIDTAASFFRYESADVIGGDESLRVYADGNDLGTYLPGDSVRLPVNATRWVITPVNSACVGTVRLGIGTVDSSRLVGNVRVIDSGADKTLEGNQFLGTVLKSATAGAYSVAAIKSKAGGPVLAIRTLGVSSSIAGDVSFGWCDDGGTATPDTAQTWRNRDVSGANSTAWKSTGTTAASNPTVGEMVGGFRDFGRIALPASELTIIPYTTPIIVRPGTVLYVRDSAVNRDLSLYVGFEEL